LNQNLDLESKMIPFHHRRIILNTKTNPNVSVGFCLLFNSLFNITNY
jgi:hypothetical protein